MPRLHGVTGYDVTSKIGTKTSAFLAKPEEYLATFGKESYLNEAEIKRAEGFLVHFLKNNGNSKDFMGLRAEIYNFSKDSSYLNLPTSCALLPHIKRAFFNTYCFTHSWTIDLNI